MFTGKTKVTCKWIVLLFIFGLCETVAAQGLNLPYSDSLTGHYGPVFEIQTKHGMQIVNPIGGTTNNPDMISSILGRYLYEGYAIVLPTKKKVKVRTENVGKLGGNNFGVMGICDKGWAVSGQTINGYAGYFQGGQNYFEGNVGIGTMKPTQKLDVAGNITASGYYDRNNTDYYMDPANTGTSAKLAGKVCIGTTNPYQSYRLTVDGAGSHYGISVRNTGDTGIESFGSNYGLRGIGNSKGVSGISTNGVGVFGKSTNGYAAEFQGNVLIRNNNGTVKVMELGEGLDYAEGFDVSENKEISPGSVLIIDPDNPGQLKISNGAYDTKVAGIAAGAKGLGSGVRLGGDQFDCNVALAGRVYCNVDATDIGVEPGDLLSTSKTPGHAMKALDYSRAQGAILGKAMETLEKGKKGQIIVLVTLQ